MSNEGSNSFASHAQRNDCKTHSQEEQGKLFAYRVSTIAQNNTSFWREKERIKPKSRSIYHNRGSYCELPQTKVQLFDKRLANRLL